MKTLNNFISISIILISFTVNAQDDDIYQKKIDLVKEARESKNNDKYYDFINSLPKEASGYFSLKDHYHQNKKNGIDPCKGVTYRAYRTTYPKKVLFFTEKNDPLFFYNCELWYVLRDEAKNCTKLEKIKIAEFLKTAADKGNVTAQFSLAYEYAPSKYESRQKLDLEENSTLFIRYMKMAAENNYSKAYNQLYLAYKDKKDYHTAVKWLEKAVNNSSKTPTRLYWELGSYYEKGLGIEKDMYKAYSNYKKAADSYDGYYYSFAFGRLLYDGTKNIEKDRELAVSYIKKAAESGNCPEAEDFCKAKSISFKEK